MTKELVISSNRHETKVAILEEDQLVEVYFQRAHEYSLAGSIHKGRVTRVLPGMQSAFVDIGLERDTFLYVTDFFEENEDYDPVPAGGEVREAREPRPDRSGRDRDGRRDRGDRGRRPDRGDRGDRERPPAAEARTELVAAVEPETAAVVEGTEPVSTEQPAAGPRPFRHRPEGDDRGRRGRRRRNRGHGFPDSKYASEQAPPRHEAEPAAPVRQYVESVRDPVVTSGDTDFSVLPGESLAKYRSMNVPPLDESEEREIQELQQPEIAGRSAAEDDADAAEAASFIETGSEHVESAEPETSEVTIVGAGQEEVVEPASGHPVADEILAEAHAASREPSEDEQHEELALAEEAVEEELAEPAPGDAPVQAEPAERQSANVREQGGRYMQRLTRRMRRRMRGGEGRPDGRPEPKVDGQVAEAEPPVEGAPAAVAAAPEPAPAAPAEAPRTAARPERGDRPPLPSITELLKEGQEIIVQIAKEPLGQKGARITSHIALPGRYVVYMPTVDHMGVSRKIPSDEERLRLKRILQTHHAGMTGGFIVRTAGEGHTEEEIAADMSFLYKLWLDIRQKAEKRPAPLLLHHDLDIVQRILRDQVTESFKAVWVDSEVAYESILSFIQRFQPALVSRVKLYTRAAPIFDAFNITAELEKALRPKVWLKSGGYIVINQTEALVAIDVNTGKYVGKSNRLEDTIVKTNTEAVKEIVRQVRLRDLGGIIVVDFIDMDERKNRQKVMQALEEAMRDDKAPNKILQFNDFGLVAITRKRVKQSLERALCSPCPYCEGAGYVKSVQTIVGDILQEAHKLAAAVEGKEVVLRVHPEVAKILKSNQNRYLEELEEILHRPVLVRGDLTIHHEKFDLA
jgi:ribonuclease G